LLSSETSELTYILPRGKPRLNTSITIKAHRVALSSLFPFIMPTTSFTSAEAVADKDGLIHGVSAEELQVIGEQCIEAKARAYCMCTQARTD
jgi:hypothetical protein